MSPELAEARIKESMAAERLGRAYLEVVDSRHGFESLYANPEFVAALHGLRAARAETAGHEAADDFELNSEEGAA